jgi:hypothetical protein
MLWKFETRLKDGYPAAFALFAALLIPTPPRAAAFHDPKAAPAARCSTRHEWPLRKVAPALNGWLRPDTQRGGSLGPSCHRDVRRGKVCSPTSSPAITATRRMGSGLPERPKSRFCWGAPTARRIHAGDSVRRAGGMLFDEDGDPSATCACRHGLAPRRMGADARGEERVIQRSRETDLRLPVGTCEDQSATIADVRQ